MVFRVSPGGCPGPIVGPKEDGERPEGRTLQREGSRIPLCDYRAGRSEGKNVGKTVEGQTGKGPDSHARVCLGGRWHTRLELSGGHPERTPPPGPVKPGGT